MLHKETDELSELFDILYRIDQRVSREENLTEDEDIKYGADTNRNTKRDQSKKFG